MLHKLASLFRRSVSFLWFACGHQLVGVWSKHHIHFAKKAIAKISSEESGHISAKFCTSKIFHYVVSILNWDVGRGLSSVDSSSGPDIVQVV